MFRNDGELYAMRFRFPHLRVPHHWPRILPGLALVAALCWNLACAADIQGVRVSIGPTGTRADIQLNTPTANNYRLLRLTNPHRLAVDFPASQFSPRFSRPQGIGVVRAVRHGTPVAGTARVVFDLTGPVEAFAPRTEQGPDGVRLIIEWPGDGGSTANNPPPAPTPPSVAPPPAYSNPPSPPLPPQPDNPAPDPGVVWPLGDGEEIVIGGSQPQAQPRTSPPPPAVQPGGSASVAPNRTQPTHATGPPVDQIAQIAAATQTGARTAARPVNTVAAVPPGTEPVLPGSGLRPLVIAIDAGHGGKDPGAIGPGGTYEKHVVLAIARELARQINATAGMRAYLVRNSDVYVERTQRARSARQVKADMFISIHADAAENHSAHGASVYTLSTTGASSQHARWLADRENSSELVGGVPLENNNTLSEVLLDLAQSGHMKASQDAARHMLNELGKVGRTHKTHVEYANFEVLRNADMPAMLVETGFISNAAEERRLKDPTYQRRLASAILDGINTFFRNQPPPGTLFAARADAQPANANGGSH